MCDDDEVSSKTFKGACCESVRVFVSADKFEKQEDSSQNLHSILK